MAYTKKELEAFGIDNQHFERMTGRPVKKFSVNKVDVGYGVHSDTYCVKVCFRDGSEIDLFAKDTYKDRNISGSLTKSTSLNKLEAEILEFGNAHNCFMPEFYGSWEFMDKNEKHTFTFMEKWPGNLEENVLCGYHDKFGEADEAGRKVITDDVVDYLLRAIDMIVWNAYQFNRPENGFNPRKSDGSPRVHAYEASAIEERLWENIFGLIEEKALEHIIPRLKTNGHGKDRYLIEASDIINILGSLKTNPFDSVMQSLYRDVRDIIKRFIAEPLAADVDNHRVHQLDPIPIHILLDETKPRNQYYANAIVDLVEGKLTDDKNPYLQLAIADYQNMGFAPEPFPIGRLVNNPAVTYLIGKDRINQLREHAQTQVKRLKEKRRDIEFYRDISHSERILYEEGLAQAGWFTVLQNIGFITLLHHKHQDKAEALVSRNAIYKPSNYVNISIDRAASLENIQDKYTPLKDLLQKLRLKP